MVRAVCSITTTETRKSCAPGELGFALFQHNEWGRPYAPNIIDQWTEERGDAVYLYWHVSTWNPYQVVLMKTMLAAPRVPRF